MSKTYWRHAALIVLIIALLPFNTLSTLPARAADPIDQAALLHDSRSDLYRTPGGAVTTGTPVTIRLRTAAGDVDSVSMRLYDQMAGTETLLPMAVIATTPEGYDLWEVTIPATRKATIWWYRFLVTKGSDTVYYEDDTRPDGGNYVLQNEGGVGTVYTQSPDLSFQITVYNPDYYTPEWMRNAVIYQIFPDRFRDGDTSNDPADGSDTFYGSLPLLFHETWNEAPVDGRVTTAPDGQGYYNSDFFGGDLAGITEKLDYLQSLGVTAIYLNPIFAARSNHRYDTADYKIIDPILGDMDSFRTLVSEAKKRGIVLILDGVFNHLSSDSVFFDRYHRFNTDGACESTDSEYRSWFFFVAPKASQPAPCAETPNNETYYISWAGFDSIPKINSGEIGPREYIFLADDSVVRFWGSEGIGGWRLDVGGDIDAGGPASNYWEAFRAVVRQTNPEAVIIGEEWGDASRWLLGKEWDATMNYRLRNGILGFVRDTDYQDNDANGDRIIYALTPSQTDNIIRAIEEDYPPMAYHAMLNILDSHDTSRLFFTVNNDPQLQKLAALLQFTLPGAPTVYYGDEISLDAPSIPDSGGNLQDDPYNRAPYPWSDASGDAYPAPNEDTLSFYQTLGTLRSEHPALREGPMFTLLADDESGVYAYLRLDQASGDIALVALNNSDSEQTVDLYFRGLVPTNLTLDPAFGGDPVTVTATEATITIPANGGNVWTANASLERPAAPTNVTADSASGSVPLSWDVVDGALGYMVFRSPVAVGGFEPLMDQPIIGETTYTDDTTVNGFKYFYAVATIGADGLIGPLSTSVQAIPSAQIDAAFYVGDDATDAAVTTYEATTLPLTVGASVDLQAGVRIAGVTETEGQAPGVRAEAALIAPDQDLDSATWMPMTYSEDLNGADVYTATLAPTTAGEYSMVARFSINAGESWTVVTQRDGTYPALIVEASDDTTPPDAPASVTIERASLSGVLISWEPSPSEDVYAYRVYRTGEDGTAQLLGEVTDATRYTDKNVAAGDVYTYGVSAVDTALNESAQTASEAATVTKGTVTTIFNVTVPDNTEGAGDVYLAGALGADYPNWDPAGLVMTQVDATHWTITLELAEGANIEYKYVRGTWDAVEKDADCQEIANRRLSATLPEGETELTVSDTVAKWRDLDACG